LYFVGQDAYSAWAVVTSAGTIIIDSIHDCRVEDEIIGSLAMMRLLLSMFF
jgi:hypothetical protein